MFLFPRLPQARLAPLYFILLVYLMLGSVLVFTTPPLEKPDEHWHYAYVAYLVQYARLPPLITDPAINPANQIAGHPPLFYGLAAVFSWVANLTLSPPPPINPYWAFPALGTVPDNKNLFIHSPADHLEAVYLLRLLSLALGAGAVGGAWALANELTGHARLSLTTAALVAFHPQFLFIAGSVSNDALVTALSTWALWALLKVMRAPTQFNRWAWFSTLAGLATLTKTNALLVPLLGIIVAVWCAWQHRAKGIAALGFVCSCGGWLLITGSWYARNAFYFGDPLGVKVHVAGGGRVAGLSLSSLPGQLQTLSVTFWGAFGWTNILLPEWAYPPFYFAQPLLLVAALWAVWRAMRRAKGNEMPYAILTVYVALVGVALVWWANTLHGTLGRLLFPALAPLMLGMALGLEQLSPHLSGVLLVYLSTLTMIAPLAIMPAYHPPPLLQAVPTALQPTDFQVGDVAQLVAFGFSSPLAQPGEIIAVTLCWRALARAPRDYSVFVQFIAPPTTIIGMRNTYPGLGRYVTTQWQPGGLFCDTYNVPIQASAPPLAVYEVQVGLFDSQTNERLPTYTATGQWVGTITLGHIKLTGPSSPPPAASTPIHANFSELIELAAAHWGLARPGQLWDYTLYWHALASPPDDYTVFVHWLDANGQIVIQDDGPPRRGRYPTNWWAMGEWISDSRQLPLPADLPPGAYWVQVGWYHPQTGQRLLLADTTDVVILGPVYIEP